MKKRFIPATIAALALSFSAVAVPQAVAQTALPAEEAASASVDLEIAFGGVKELSKSDLLQETNFEEGVSAGGIDVEDISGAAFFQGEEAANWLSYDVDEEQLTVTEAAKAGVYELDVVITTTSGTDVETFNGSIVIEVTGVTLTGEGRDLTANNRSQSTGIVIAGDGGATEITAVDEDGQELRVSVNNNDRILITPGEDVDGPITLTVNDPSLTQPLIKTIGVEGHEADVDDNDSDVVVDGTTRTVEPAATSQFTGLAVSNHDDETEFSALDEDDQNLAVVVREDGQIFVTPGINVDGPITLTVTDETLVDGAQSFVIEVNGHEEDVDDNDSGEVAPPAFGGTARAVNPTGESQDTGLDVLRSTADTVVSAIDEDDETVPSTVSANGSIFVTPGVGLSGPITVTISDPSLDEALTRTVQVEEADEDNGSSLSSVDSSSADGINWGLVGLGGVLAAVIGVIAAIGGGFIQLPPALANLIPFL